MNFSFGDSGGDTLNRVVSAFAACVLFALGATAAANPPGAPIVAENTIRWEEPGWFQVLSLPDYRHVCEGGVSCVVTPGEYAVINHSTGARWQPVVVGAVAGTMEDDVAITVSGNVVSWPDDGWYQLLAAQSFVSICEGALACTVPDGQYIVINHTTGRRWENVRVPAIGSGEGTPPLDDDAPLVSPIPVVPNLSWQRYSDSAVEISWGVEAVVPGAAGYDSVEVYLDGVEVYVGDANSWFSNNVPDGVNYRVDVYTVRDGQRSEPASATIVSGLSALPSLFSDAFLFEITQAAALPLLAANQAWTSGMALPAGLQNCLINNDPLNPPTSAYYSHIDCGDAQLPVFGEGFRNATYLNAATFINAGAMAAAGVDPVSHSVSCVSAGAPADTQCQPVAFELDVPIVWMSVPSSTPSCIACGIMPTRGADIRFNPNGNSLVEFENNSNFFSETRCELNPSTRSLRNIDYPDRAEDCLNLMQTVTRRLAEYRVDFLM